MVLRSSNDQSRRPPAFSSQEKDRAHGRLKVFLGYAPGVGTTFAMLDAARSRREQGQNVLIGAVDTHGLPGTEALLFDWNISPPEAGSNATVLNLDGILNRNPDLVVVDNLAIQNPPQARHPRRYQDVDELLAAGIDVFATCNIYHLESLKDLVSQITGLVVTNTIPDRVLLEADDIELIDFPPKELIHRMREGKIYPTGTEEISFPQLFQKQNLDALREMTLNWVAKRVDQHARSAIRLGGEPVHWPVRETILVCVSEHSRGERIVRTAARLAADLQAGLIAVYVKTPTSAALPLDRKIRVQATLKLAEELGAQCVTLLGESVADEILAFARRENVTKIVLGKSSSLRWPDLLRKPISEKLLRSSGGIDVYVLGESGSQPADWEDWIKQLFPHRPYHRYVWSVLLVAGVTLVGVPLHLWINPTNLVMLYLAAVVISALWLGRGPALITSFLGVLAFDYFLIEPRLTLTVADTEYIITFVGLVFVGLLVSNMVVANKEQLEALRRREAQTGALHSLSRDLAIAFELDEILRAVLGHVEAVFSRNVVILLPQGGVLAPRLATPGFVLSDNELDLARWCFDHHSHAGRGTDTRPDANIRFLPMQTGQNVVGVLGITPIDPGSYLTPDQRQLLEGFANLAALAIERAQFAEQASQAEMLKTADKLQNALLNSVSHDLRTPLATITGVLATIKESKMDDNSPRMDEESRAVLVDTALEEAGRLNRFVGNLLEMTRLEAGSLKIRRQPCEVGDLIGTVARQMEERLRQHVLKINLTENLPLINVDFVLMTQVFVNLFDNAVKYSPEGSLVEIEAEVSGDFLCVRVMDQGVGIPAEDLARVFDKFYRVQRKEHVSGTGLGLSISMGIVEAHGGRITAENRPGGGAILSVFLPVQAEQRSV